MITYILAALAGVAIVALDQYTKFFIDANYVLAESHTFIPGLIDITYVRNTGAAWGMLSDRTWILISVTTVIMLVCIYLIIKYGTRNRLLFWAMIFVLSGGIGNMIDRIFRGGSVVDFLHFTFWQEFPVFNIADCAIVSGASMLVLYFIIDLWRETRAGKNLNKVLPDNKNELK